MVDALLYIVTFWSVSCTIYETNDYSKPFFCLEYIALSFTPSLIPLSQILPLVVSLLPPGLPSRTTVRTVSSDLLAFVFIFSLFFRFWAVRWIKLAIWSAFERTLNYRIISYLIVSLDQTSMTGWRICHLT